MKSYPTESSVVYPVYSATVERLQDLVELPYPSKHFVLMLAADFNNMSSEEITKVAKRLIDKGLAYICTWGPSCEEAHDAFDLANILWEDETKKEFHVMSTWHSEEPIQEALWFALFSAFVDEKIWEQTSTVCVSIANQEWYKIIEHSLSDIKMFNENMVNA
jgi:hypothetical protein